MLYLLEDDDSIRKLVVYGLQTQGYTVCGFSHPSEFWKAMERQTPELILLDIMLPEEDGLHVLARLRGGSRHVPVILLTAKNTEYDRVIGLDAGADDFISKPFGILELAARIRAVLRRSGEKNACTEYRCGGLYVCPERHVVRVDGEEVALTNKEFDLLCLLLQNEGMVLTRGVLLERVWGLDSEPENRTLDVHIRTLRVKLGSAGGCIETVRGVGYKLGGTP